MPRSPSYSLGEVVVVPFPFTERGATKRRPALVCSSRTFNDNSGRVVLAMITTAAHPPWPGDVPLTDPQSAGLPKAATVRWKFFTLDASCILRRVGTLGAKDFVACAREIPISL